MLFDDIPHELPQRTPDKGKVGRPTKYSPEVAEQLCAKLSTSQLGLKQVAKDMGYTPSKVWEWLAKYPEFRELYVRAREFQTELWYDDMLSITMAPYTHNGRPADDEEEPGIPLEGAAAFAETNRRKLIVDTLKWMLSKLQPRRFGTNYQAPPQARLGTVTADQFNQLLETARKAALPPQLEAGEETEYEEM